MIPRANIILSKPKDLGRGVYSLRRFFSEQTQAFQHRPVGHGKNNRRFFVRSVFEMVPVPRRHEEAVMSAPGEIFAGRFFLPDVCQSFALDDVIDGAAGVAVRRGALARRDHLHPAADGRHGRAAGERVSVFQQDAVVRITFASCGDVI